MNCVFELKGDCFVCKNCALSIPKNTIPEIHQNNIRCNCRYSCSHLGNALRRQKCQGCQGNVDIKIYECAVHGECTLSKAFDNIASCQCEHYKPSEIVDTSHTNRLFGVPPEQLEAARTAEEYRRHPHRTEPPPRDFAKEVLPPLNQEYFEKLNAECEKEFTYPADKKLGKGIVIGAGGSTFFSNAWAVAYVLTYIGCPLPIEFWVLGDYELDPEMRAIAEGFGVRCINAAEVVAGLPPEEKPKILCGWQLKPFALAHSAFQECLYLDADNIPAVDPTFLFYTPEYKHYRSIFWPDIPYGGQLGPDRFEWLPPDVWGQIGLPYRNEFDFESGQFVIDCKSCWKELNVSLHINTNSDYWYNIIFGDKSSYHLAWRKCGRDYAIPKHTPGGLGPAILQFDFDGQPLFQHAVGGKGAIKDGKGLDMFKNHHLIYEAADELRKRWKRIYDWDAQSEDETGIAKGLLGTYLYRRIPNPDGRGGGERYIDLADGGSITVGQAAGEKRWSLRILDGKPTLVIIGEAAKGSEIGMMMLRQDDDGTWRGRWSEFEKNPAELVKL